jgi:hypothetical protein
VNSKTRMAALNSKSAFHSMQAGSRRDRAQERTYASPAATTDRAKLSFSLTYNLRYVRYRTERNSSTD